MEDNAHIGIFTEGQGDGLWALLTDNGDFVINGLGVSTRDGMPKGVPEFGGQVKVIGTEENGTIMADRIIPMD